MQTLLMKWRVPHVWYFNWNKEKIAWVHRYLIIQGRTIHFVWIFYCRLENRGAAAHSIYYWCESAKWLIISSLSLMKETWKLTGDCKLNCFIQAQHVISVIIHKSPNLPVWTLEAITKAIFLNCTWSLISSITTCWITRFG
jgi:hypothetical protein